jgi:hypothetical protein
MQKLFRRMNAIGSNALIAGTQVLERAGLIRAPGNVSVVGDGEYRYRVNRHWCQANPQLLPVNNCHEMVIDSQQRLYLLTDEPRNNVIVFDCQGKVLNHWTLNSSSAHGLTLVHEGGQEYLWICCPYEGRVVKTTLAGEVLMTLPDPQALGVYASTQPYLPTQVAVASNGDIYVADGYGSNYVVQFNARGEYLRRFGGKRAGDASLDFAHGIAIDNRRGAANEILLVTSRRESCFKQFSLQGDYIGTIPLPGAYPCRPVISGDKVLAGLCWSGAHLKPNTGFVVMLDADNRVCATPGGQARYNGQGKLQALVPDYSVFHHVHDVCADSAGNLYVCQWNAGKLYPWKLERIITNKTINKEGDI